MSQERPDWPEPDPRPRGRDASGAWRLLGSRCAACAYFTAERVPHCPRCRAEVHEAEAGPSGTVWSWSTVRVEGGGRVPPYTLAYVDVEDGPRVLARWRGDAPPRVGEPVRLAGLDDAGDVIVEAA